MFYRSCLRQKLTWNIRASKRYPVWTSASYCMDTFDHRWQITRSNPAVVLADVRTVDHDYPGAHAPNTLLGFSLAPRGGWRAVRDTIRDDLLGCWFWLSRLLFSFFV